MNAYLIIGLVCTMAGLLIWIHDYIDKRGENKGPTFNRTNDRSQPENGYNLIVKCEPPKQEPFINHRGLMCIREYRTDALGYINYSTGETVVLEEHEITIKRRALDKLQYQGMLGQPKTVVYETVIMRVR